MQIKEDLSYPALVEKLKAYLTGDLAPVARAYTLAAEAHKDQVRQSGEPYIIHPLAVAHILADLQMDIESICVGLLHDVIEDTATGRDEIIAMFGEGIADLVDGLTKLGKINFASTEEKQIDNFRKMFFAMAKDIRVIIIKLADRLHNMRTLKFKREERQLEIAKETIEVYAPLANRLGLQRIKWELEDLSLRYLDPIAYYDIVQGVKRKKEERDAFIKALIERIETKLHESDLSPTVYGRAKHFYSIYRKMFTQNKSLDEIYDLFAVRVIVNTVEECYMVLGIVHDLYKPIPGRFKDYIAMPKPNKYQSLHTSVIGPGGQPFEIQIRTWDMHEIAERGIAAHWQYKEGGTNADREKYQWVHDLVDMQKDVNNSEDFFRLFKIDLFTDEVFVFSPKGDVFNLPIGSTPIDFAFMVHTQVGYRMTGAKVNGKIVNLDHVLENGDIVEIITGTAFHSPGADWLKICKTSQARNKIKQWFKKERRDEYLALGKELLEKELLRHGYKKEDLWIPKYLEIVFRRYNFYSEEDLYVGMGCGGISANRVVLRLADCNRELQRQREEKALQEKLAAGRDTAPQKPTKEGVIVEGESGCLLKLAHCCNPVPGDAIVGFITKGHGVTVHRADCVNVDPVNLTEDNKKRLIGCTWAEGTQVTYPCGFILEVSNRAGILADISAAITAQALSITALNARTLKNGMGIIELTVAVKDRSAADRLNRAFHQIQGVFDVRRTNERKQGTEGWSDAF